MEKKTSKYGEREWISIRALKLEVVLLFKMILL